MRSNTTIHSIARCLVAAAVATAPTFAQTGETASNRVVTVAFDKPASGHLYLNDGSDATPATTFKIEMVPEGLRFDFLAEGAVELQGDFEFYFQAAGEPVEGNHYQFYTNFKRLEAHLTAAEQELLAARGISGDFHPALRPHYSYFTQPTKRFQVLREFKTSLTAAGSSAKVEVFIPWNALYHILPYTPDGKGQEWRFSAFRNADGVRSAWQGALKKPATWGRLRFADITESELAQLYRTIATQNSRSGKKPRFDPTLFASDSLPAALAKVERARALIEQRLPAADTTLQPAAMAALAAGSAELHNWREVIATIHTGTRMEWAGWTLESVERKADGAESATPLPFVAKSGYLHLSSSNKPAPGVCRDNSLPANDAGATRYLRLTYTFTNDHADAIWLTDLCATLRTADERKLLLTVALNDAKLLTEHDPAVAPTNLPLPAIKQGDKLVLTLREAAGRAVTFSLFGRLEALRFGLEPRQAINHNAPLPTDKFLPVKRDHEYDMHHINIFAGEQSTLLLEKPRVIQYGGWFEIGFVLHERELRNELYQKYRLAQSGNIMEHMLITNFKIANTPLDYLKPELIIISADTAYPASFFTAEQVCAAYDESLALIRSRLPEVKIVMLGIVPRDRQLPRLTKLNQKLMEWAAANKITYRDLFPRFY